MCLICKQYYVLQYMCAHRQHDCSYADIGTVCYVFFVFLHLIYTRVPRQRLPTRYRLTLVQQNWIAFKQHFHEAHLELQETGEQAALVEDIDCYLPHSRNEPNYKRTFLPPKQRWKSHLQQPRIIAQPIHHPKSRDDASNCKQWNCCWQR